MISGVTSWWLSQTLQTAPTNIVRKMWVHSSDVSDRVLKWPSLGAHKDDFRAARISVSFADGDDFFDFFISSEDAIYNNLVFQFGFNHASSGDELVTVFQGIMENVNFPSSRCKITAKDRFGILEHEYLGTPDSAHVYSDTPGDIAWDVLTSKHSFSSIESTSNPDIDYTSFETWRDYYDTNNIYLSSNFEGARYSEIIKKVARYTDSAIWVQNNKIHFSRVVGSGTGTSYNDDETLALKYIIDKSKKVNKFTVYADYNVDSGEYEAIVSDQTSADVSSRGIFEKNYKDDTLWFVGSAGALLTCQKIINQNTRIKPSSKLETTLRGMRHTLGEALTISTDKGSISDTHGIKGYKVDYDSGEVELDLDSALVVTLFTLDESELDGIDVLG